MTTIPCAIVRGGTSKGVFVREEHLPPDPEQRDAVLLQLMGSPDPRQVDGLGGADPLTSKVAIISRPTHQGVDVEYESLEVGIREAKVNHGLMCGNLIAGVGYFAMAEGLVAPRAPSTTVNIYCRSNGKTITARIPVATNSEWQGGAGQVSLLFHDPAGGVTGRLLPAGGPLCRLTAGTQEVEVSIVDAGTLYAFVSAADFGVSADDDVAALDANARFRAAIEALRAQVAARVNRQCFSGAPIVAPALVKMAVVGPAGDAHVADIAARIINKAGAHKAYAVSGGISLAAAATIPGTLVQRIVGNVDSPLLLRIGHPTGVLTLGMHWSNGAQGPTIDFAEIERTARIVMRGTAYVTADIGEPARQQVEAEAAA